MFADESDFVIEQGLVDGFKVLAFEDNGMTGEVKGELAGFVELNSDKISIGEGPAIAGFKDDIQSDGSLSIDISFRG